MEVRIGRGVLPAGGVAAIAFAVLAFPLDLILWFSMALAVTVYVGVVLVWSPGVDQLPLPAHNLDTPEHVAYEEALTLAAKLRTRADQIIKVDVQARVVRMLDRADRIMFAMNEDGNLAAAPVFSEGWLKPLDVEVSGYVRLSGRDVKSARVRADKVESCHLARFEAAVDAFDEELNRASEVDVAALMVALESNLQGLDRLVSTEAVPELPATALPDPADSSAATGSFSPGATAARNAARLGLTPREHEIVVLLVQRLRNKEIATRLSIAVRTVENHVARILDKLGLDSRDDVAAFAFDNGLLPPSTPPDDPPPPDEPPSGNPPAPESPTPPE